MRARKIHNTKVVVYISYFFVTDPDLRKNFEVLQIFMFTIFSILNKKCLDKVLFIQITRNFEFLPYAN